MTSAPRILLLGRNGQVGYEMERLLPALGVVTALGRAQADLADPAALRAALRHARPQFIVNAAAYTAVDRAEQEPDLAQAVNAVAPGILGEEAQALGATVLHFSTDYVFDGTATAPYTEDDAVNPLNVYGRTKLEGERRLAASGASAVVLRTGWVYGTRGRNFLRTMVARAQEQDELRVVSDQFGGPTWSRALAQGAAALLRRLMAGGPAPGGLRLYHLSNAGQTSWHGFAAAIVEHLRRRGPVRARGVTPIATADFPTPARRPPYSVLSCARIAAQHGIALPAWQHSLAEALGGD